MEQYCHKLQNFPRVPIKVTRAVIAIISSKRSSFLYDPASCSSKIVTAFTSIVELFSVRRRRLVSVSSSGKLFCLWNVKTIANFLKDNIQVCLSIDQISCSSSEELHALMHFTIRIQMTSHNFRYDCSELLFTFAFAFNLLISPPTLKPTMNPMFMSQFSWMRFHNKRVE